MTKCNHHTLDLDLPQYSRPGLRVYNLEAYLHIDSSPSLSDSANPAEVELSNDGSVAVVMETSWKELLALVA